MQRKVFIVGGGQAYAQMFKSKGWSTADDLDEADLVQFTGGSDVSPVRYGEFPHKTTQSSYHRDVTEANIFEQCVALGLPMAGICRGGQFLNVMNGGKMYQDVDNHAISGTHEAFIIGVLVSVQVSSTHHQMMRPNYSPQMETIVLMTARLSTRLCHMSELEAQHAYELVTYRQPDKKLTEDIEAIYYGRTNCLCYQPHPEFTGAQYDECRDLYFRWIEECLFEALE